MKIGLDLDGTVYAHQEFFSAMIESMSAAGHEFYCTSSHGRNQWDSDCQRLRAAGINPDLISPELMFPQQHGDVRKKTQQANQLDVVFDDDYRVQEGTKTVVFCPLIGGHVRVQHGKISARF